MHSYSEGADCTNWKVTALIINSAVFSFLPLSGGLFGDKRTQLRKFFELNRIFVNFPQNIKHPPFLESCSKQKLLRAKLFLTITVTLSLSLSLSLSYSKYQQTTTQRSCPPLGLFLDTRDSPMIHILGWAYWIRAVLAQPQVFPHQSKTVDVSQYYSAGCGVQVSDYFRYFI